jgi:hypothetical protein
MKPRIILKLGRAHGHLSRRGAIEIDGASNQGNSPTPRGAMDIL